MIFKLIPRNYRKFAWKIILVFKEEMRSKENSQLFSNWSEFLNYQIKGAEDG